MSKGIRNAIAKQSAPQTSVNIEMLTFYVIQNITVCYAAINGTDFYGCKCIIHRFPNFFGLRILKNKNN